MGTWRNIDITVPDRFAQSSAVVSLLADAFWVAAVRSSSRDITRLLLSRAGAAIFFRLGSFREGQFPVNKRSDVSFLVI